MDDTSFSLLVVRATRSLDSVDLDHYYGPLQSTDAEISSLVQALGNATAPQRRAFSDGLTALQRRAIGRYALRAPMLAWRARDPRYLYSGLAAHSLLRQTVPDWRDDLVAYAPYYHVARTLGLPPVDVFRRGAEVATPELAEIMRVFGARTDVTLEAFGWRAVETEDGPTFEEVSWSHTDAPAIVGERSWDTVHGAQFERLQRWARGGKL